MSGFPKSGHICNDVCVCVCVCVCVYVYVCLYIWLCMYVAMYTYVYVCTGIYELINISLHSVVCFVCFASRDVVVAVAVASVAAAVVANFVLVIQTIPIINLMMKKRHH